MAEDEKIHEVLVSVSADTLGVLQIMFWNDGHGKLDHETLVRKAIHVCLECAERMNDDETRTD